MDAGTYQINVFASQAQGQEDESQTGSSQLSLEATFTLIIESDASESASGETGCNDMDFACQIMLSVGSGEGM